EAALLPAAHDLLDHAQLLLEPLAVLGGRREEGVDVEAGDLLEGDLRALRVRQLIERLPLLLRERFLLLETLHLLQDARLGGLILEVAPQLVLIEADVTDDMGDVVVRPATGDAAQNAADELRVG